jgi:FkbM family methyltransferase
MKETVRRFLPTRVKAHKIRRGPLKGRVIVTSWHDYPGAILGRTESDLLRWFSANVNSGETWLDVGAHYGYTAIALAERVGSTGRVFAFEPVVSTAAQLSITKSLNQLDRLGIVPLGLGSSRGMHLINVPMVRGMAQHDGLSGAMCQVCIVPLDDIWGSLSEGTSVIHGIKIDVQGAEYDVVLGMQRYLAELKPILVVELHSGVDRTRFVSLLESIGYDAEGKAVDGGTGGVRYEDDKSYVFRALHRPRLFSE